MKTITIVVKDDASVGRLMMDIFRDYEDKIACITNDPCASANEVFNNRPYPWAIGDYEDGEEG